MFMHYRKINQFIFIKFISHIESHAAPRVLRLFVNESKKISIYDERRVSGIAKISKFNLPMSIWNVAKNLLYASSI